MREGGFIFSPIVSSNTKDHFYFFKVGYSDPVDIRVIKQELIDILRSKDFDVEDKVGWFEE